MVLKILHRPTLTKLVEDFATPHREAAVDKDTETLLFAMYFVAVTSLSAEACLADLGETRAVLVARYRLATEVALARADYLNSSQIEPLQAFALYIVR